MPEGNQFKFEAIGTQWVIDVFGKNSQDLLNLEKKINSGILNFTKTFSRFDKQSEIYLGSLNPRQINLPENYLPLLEIYFKLYKLTGGLFSPLVGNLLVETGYDTDYSLVSKKVNPVKEWHEIISYQPRVLEIKKPWMLDFGAGGKGFLIDLIANLLEKEKIDSYYIDGSGDILVKNKSLKVGLEHPGDFSKVIGVAEIKNQSICASAGNRRKWGKYHHIFNPKTLKSVEDVLAVWVIADTALVADCLATCLFLIEPEKLTAEFEFQYLIVYKNYTFKKSSAFPGEIYYN